jgi:hypothetical protein
MMWRLVLAFGAIMMVAPSMESNWIGLAVQLPVAIQQYMGWKRRQLESP